jgi:cyanophycinase-like exopeptidase
LIRVLDDTGTQFGYGVDEDTALVVTGVNTTSVMMRVIGEGGVSIFNMKGAYDIEGVRTPIFLPPP